MTLRYTSTTDASAIGGMANENVVLTFSYDSSLINNDGFTGGFANPPSYDAIYGPWSGMLQVGSDLIDLAGGAIEITDDQTVGISSGNPEVVDGFTLYWSPASSNSRYSATSEGLLFGKTLSDFSLTITDESHLMFPSKALPEGATFAQHGDYIDDRYAFADGSSFGSSSGPHQRAFEIVSVPEPSPAMLLGFGVTILLGLKLPSRMRFQTRIGVANARKMRNPFRQ